MKTIPNPSWTEKNPSTGEEKKVFFTQALGSLISQAPQDKIPKGFDHFRFFNRLAKAFERAEKDGGTLELEDGDYGIVKKLVQEEINPKWGSSKAVYEAFEAFLEAKNKE